MQFTNAALLSLLATISLAAPARRAEAVTNTVVGSWTILSFTRTCNTDNTSCDVSFGIDTDNNGTSEQDVKYTITGAPASQATLTATNFGNYTLTSSWNAQGFTVWSLVNNPSQVIAFPGYADSELVNGQAVSPNKAFAVQTLPL